MFIEFELPYIIQPEGNFEFKFREEIFTVSIKHQILPELRGLLTGFIYGTHQVTISDKATFRSGNAGVSVRGPREIFKGTSKVKVVLPPTVRDAFDKRKSDTEVRRIVVDILNEFQYQYLHHSGKYWWNSVSQDHFISSKITMESSGIASLSFELEKAVLPYKEDEEALPSFGESLKLGERLPPEIFFLIDAKNHFLTGQYHLMYVELGIAFERLVNKAHQKLYGSEKRRFTEGKLIGQLNHLLFQYCKWSSKDLKAVEEICQNRNYVVHTNKRYFELKKAHKHIIADEKVIGALQGWLNQ